MTIEVVGIVVIGENACRSRRFRRANIRDRRGHCPQEMILPPRTVDAGLRRWFRQRVAHTGAQLGQGEVVFAVVVLRCPALQAIAHDGEGRELVPACCLVQLFEIPLQVEAHDIGAMQGDLHAFPDLAERRSLLQVAGLDAVGSAGLFRQLARDGPDVAIFDDLAGPIDQREAADLIFRTQAGRINLQKTEIGHGRDGLRPADLLVGRCVRQAVDIVLELNELLLYLCPERRDGRASNLVPGEIRQAVDPARLSLGVYNAVKKRYCMIRVSAKR